MISLSRIPYFRFSTATITNKTYSKFQEKYTASIEAMRLKVSATSEASDSIKKSTRKVYVHPYNCPHRMINISPIKSLQLDMDFIGVEQVSPHFENFGFARKNALLMWGGLLVMKFLAETEDFFMFARAGV
jgi:hypothetical protein